MSGVCRFITIMFFVYILRSVSTGQFYIGSTGDVAARVARHNSGGSTFTRRKGPWELVWSQAFHTRGEAVKEESRLKRRKDRAYIERLISVG